MSVQGVSSLAVGDDDVDDPDRWFERATTSASDWPIDLLLKLKRQTRICVLIPAHNEAATVGDIASAIIRDLVSTGLVDEFVVMDSDSDHNTARQASQADASVHTVRAIRPDLGSFRGKGEALRLVHTASRVAFESNGSGFAYSVRKLAVVHLVRMAATEVEGTGITVNCVVPSIVDTPANRASMPNSDHTRWPAIADVAAAYLFLASPAAQLISGSALPVYGRA